MFNRITKSRGKHKIKPTADLAILTFFMSLFGLLLAIIATVGVFVLASFHNL